MEPPKYVVLTSEFAITSFMDKRAVGFQYLDADGNNVFLAIPGKILRLIIDDLETLIEKIPGVEEWDVPPVPDVTTH